MSLQDKCDQHHPAINAGFNDFKRAHEAAISDAPGEGCNPVKVAIWQAKFSAAVLLMRLACKAAKECAEDAGGVIQPLSGGQDKD